VLGLILLIQKSAPAQNKPGHRISGVPQVRNGTQIQVSDAGLAAQIVAQGGRLMADYGSYQLYEAPQIPPEPGRAQPGGNS